jgi:tetratricopeptide (TPR) repeat protein
VRPRRSSSFVIASALLVLFGTAVVCEVARDRIYGEPKPARGVLYIQSGTAVKRMALSYSSVLADVYWIRALQYYGGNRLSSDGQRDYTLLYPLLDITTTLDPYFDIAYRFGAIYLAEDYPGGAGRPDLAVKLLEKGYERQPGKWRYLQDIGFVHYWWRSDFSEAAAWFEKAAKVPGAPWWMKSLAAVTLAEGGDRRSSRILWESLLNGGDNDWLRREAERRLGQLDAMDQLDVLKEAAQRYALATGRVPASWQDLIRAGYLRSEPYDPTGTPYRIDQPPGVVRLSRASPLYPLPTGQKIRPVPAPR